MSQLEMNFRQIVLRNSYNPARWFKQTKRTVSFDVKARFNPIQQSTAMYNSHIFNSRITTINVACVKRGRGRGIWARESAWHVVSRPNFLHIPFRTSATQATINDQLTHSKYTEVF